MGFIILSLLDYTDRNLHTAQRLPLCGSILLFSFGVWIYMLAWDWSKGQAVTNEIRPLCSTICSSICCFTLIQICSFSRVCSFFFLERNVPHRALYRLYQPRFSALPIIDRGLRHFISNLQWFCLHWLNMLGKHPHTVISIAQRYCLFQLSINTMPLISIDITVYYII